MSFAIKKKVKGGFFTLNSVYEEDILAKEEWKYVLATEFQLLDYRKKYLGKFKEVDVKEIEALIDAYRDVYEIFSSFLDWITIIFCEYHYFYSLVRRASYHSNMRYSLPIYFIYEGLCFVEKKGRIEALHSKYDFDDPISYVHRSNFLYNKKRFITALEEELRSLKELRSTFLSAGRF